MAAITKTQILDASQRLSAWVTRTSCVRQGYLSKLVSRRIGHPVELFLKYEGQQHSGSFKYRGAMNRILALSQLNNGLITCSTGNHALAVKYATNQLTLRGGQKEVPVYVVVKSNIATQKLQALKDAGVKVVGGERGSMKECRERAISLGKSMGCNFIDPAHPDITTGQATASVEFSQQVMEQTGASLDTIFLPCGGGSLLAGSATYFARSRTRVIGAEPAQAGPRLGQSLKWRRLLNNDAQAVTVADGLNTSLWEKNWEILLESGMLAGVVSVSEDSILSALRLHQAATTLTVEPTSCVALSAALFYHKISSQVRPESHRPWVVGVMMTGSNV